MMFGQLLNTHRIFKQLAYAQVDLRLCCSHIPHCWKSLVAAQKSKAI